MSFSDYKFYLADGTKIFSANELSEAVYNTIHHYEDRAAEAYKRAAMTREEVASEIKNDFEEENKRIKEQLRFSIASVYSQKELDAYNAFVEKHTPCRLKKKIDGGKMPYVRQYGTGLGVCTTVYCPVCEASEDITDTSCW